MDLPVDFAGPRADVQFDSLAAITRPAFSPLDTWVNDTTALASAMHPEIAPLDPESIAGALNEQGWVASVDGDCVRITMTFPNLFRQVFVSSDAESGNRIRTELVQVAGWPKRSYRAAMNFAREVNRRLHLARISMAGEPERPVLLAEVHLGSAPLPGPWLEIGLETIRAMISLSAKQLPALRDPKLAELAFTGTSSEQGVVRHEHRRSARTRRG